MSVADSPDISLFRPSRDFFIGIDSDGCVLDTMDIKQQECLIPTQVLHFQLQSVSRLFRETAEFVNLHSRYRGRNRFVNLVVSLDFLSQRSEARRRGFRPLPLESLRQWIEEESRLGNGPLEERIRREPDPFLERALAWSRAADEAVAAMVQGVTPFPGCPGVLEKLGQRADLMVFSQTQTEALEREWATAGLRPLVQALLGPEYGPKEAHIRKAAGGRYSPDHILMIGDAWSDYQAAQANEALFYPILPGEEEASWAALGGEGLARFTSETFRGDYQKELLAAFKAKLPLDSPWPVNAGE